MNVYEMIAFIAYFVLVIGVGIYFFFKSKGNAGEKDYFLGGRDMNGLVAALSAGASDMSAWVLMGLPGAFYATGLSNMWISVGLFIGTACAWIFIAPRLRRFSIAYNDSITIPQYLTNRFQSDNKLLLIICAVIFVVAYCIYAASSISACGTLFNTVMGIDRNTAMIGAAVIMRPSKSVMDFTTKSLKKKFKDKRFAAGCSRDVITQGAEMLGWELPELFDRTIAAMQSFAPDRDTLQA